MFPQSAYTKPGDFAVSSKLTETVQVALDRDCDLVLNVDGLFFEHLRHEAMFFKLEKSMAEFWAPFPREIGRLGQNKACLYPAHGFCIPESVKLLVPCDGPLVKPEENLSCSTIGTPHFLALCQRGVLFNCRHGCLHVLGWDYLDHL